ncbi:hypothetical protein [Streptomyces sp. 8N706]|uniref:hypothetical protein n=1 Tax=Streptomyces sp. 8N706 TaxID=3457416 RepID=UPI003FD172F6
MLVAFARYSRDGSFTVLRANLRFTLVLAAGSIAGTATMEGRAMFGMLSVLAGRPRRATPRSIGQQDR